MQHIFFERSRCKYVYRLHLHFRISGFETSRVEWTSTRCKLDVFSSQYNSVYFYVSNMTNKILCVIEWAANKVRRKFDVFYVARTNVMTTSASRNTFMVT